MRIIFTTLISTCLLIHCYAGSTNDSIQSLLNQCTSDTQKVRILLDAGKKVEFKDPGLSFDYAKEAVKLSEKINYINGKADAYVLMGLLSEDAADYEKAKRNFNNALELYKNSDNRQGIGTVYNNLGSMYEYTGAHDTAIIYFNKSIGVNDEIGNEISAADSRYNLGLIHHTKGNYDLALANWFGVIDVYEKLKDFEGLAACQHCIGMTLRKQAKDREAQEYLEKARENGIKSGDNRLVANIINSMGNIYLVREVFDSALMYFREAIVLYDKAGDLYGIASVKTNIGDYYKYEKRIDSAIFYYHDSYKRFHQLGIREGETHTLAELAECCLLSGDFEKALEYCNEAMIVAGEINSKYYQALIYQLIFKIHNKKGDYSKALENYIKYTELKDSMFNESKQEIIEEMQTRYETEKKEQQIIIQSATISAQQAENRKQQIIIISATGGFVIVLIFSIIILYMFRQKRKANILLAKQNEEIIQQKEEISAQRDEIEAQRDKVQEQKDHILKQKNEIDDSIRYAKRIQTAVLPADKYADSILGDHFIIFRPKDVVSGDFYWATFVGMNGASTVLSNRRSSLHDAPNKKSGILVVAVADCTGHGVPGAFMSMLGISFLNEIVRKKDVTDAASILNHLRTSVIEALKQSAYVETSAEATSEDEIRKDIPPASILAIKDGMDMSIIAIHKDRKRALWAGANNPLWIIRNTDQQGYINGSNCQPDGNSHDKGNLAGQGFIEIKPDNMPVAIHNRMDEFTNHELSLRSGDRFYIFSDGFADQFGGPEGKKFKYKAFKSLIAETAVLSMNEQGKRIEQELDKWMTGYGKKYDQIDDITVLGLQIE